MSWKTSSGLRVRQTTAPGNHIYQLPLFLDAHRLVSNHLFKNESSWYIFLKLYIYILVCFKPFDPSICYDFLLLNPIIQSFTNRPKLPGPSFPKHRDRCHTKLHTASVVQVPRHREAERIDLAPTWFCWKETQLKLVQLSHENHPLTSLTFH